MDSVISFGPLALATDRLLAVGLLLSFLLAMDRILLRADRDALPTTAVALILGFLSARIAYVAQHRDAYAQDWWSAFAVWQGGFTAWAGLLVAGLVLASRIRPFPVLAKGLATLSLLGAVWFAGSALIRPEPSPFPDLPQLAGLNGTPIAIEGLAGRPFVVNLWATWCPPCRRELPMLADIAEDAELPVLLVNQGERPAAIRDYLFANRISGDTVVVDRSAAFMRAFETAALPTTIFVDGSGQVVGTHHGEISRAEMMARIAELQGE